MDLPVTTSPSHHLTLPDLVIAGVVLAGDRWQPHVRHNEQLGPLVYLRLRLRDNRIHEHICFETKAMYSNMCWKCLGNRKVHVACD